MKWLRALIGSLSFRLALTYVALFVVSMLLVLGAYYLIVIRLPLEDAKRQVEREEAVLSNVYIVDGQAALVARLQAREEAPDPRKPFHAFIDRHGAVVTANLPSWPRRATSNWLRLEADAYFDGDEIDYEAIALDRRFDDGARLLLGRDIENISRVEETLGSGAFSALGVAIVVGLIGGALMSLAIGRRIEAVGATARQVMAGDLSQRVPVRGSNDDFDRLAETLNLMLARIETAVEAVRRVSDSVAHELRTPLARLKADLDDAMAGDPGERDGRLHSAVAEAERLETIFDAVLRIARIEAGRHAAAMRPVDLSTLLDDVADYYRPAAEECGLAFEAAIDPALMVEGDADLIFQAMANLFDNAIKFTPRGGSIQLSARGTAEVVTILLVDSGPGIAPADRGRVTERFYRGAATAHAAGAGLGLSLVAAVAELHRSVIGFEDAIPGLRVRWTLDRLPPA
jgi:signal transduction histidine kinase